MNRLSVVLKFVEIQTKVASVFPFLAGTLMAIYFGVSFKPLNALLMLLSLLCIDMTTTGLNHYVDYKKAILKTGYHFDVHNPLGQGALKNNEALVILAALLITGVGFGILLVIRTDYWVLFLGALAFGIGLLYSAGPMPISRTFLGETFSGIFMGGLIPLIAFYVHAYDMEPFLLALEGNRVILSLDFHLIAPVIWISLPLVFLISNIMLANNVCDMDEDSANKRHTLPIAIGLKRSLSLYKLLVFLSFFVIAFGILMGVLPKGLGIVFFGSPIIVKQTKKFLSEQKKGITFVTAVKNFVVFSILLNVALIASIVLK